MRRVLRLLLPLWLAMRVVMPLVAPAVPVATVAAVLTVASEARADPIFKVCVKPDGIGSATTFAFVGGHNKIVTTKDRAEFEREAHGETVFVYDADAPADSVRRLPIPFNHLRCPPKPAAPPEAAQQKESAAKPGEKVEKKTKQ